MEPVNPGPVLEIAGVSYTYPGADSPALREVSLTAGAGEGIALLGHNGAGKTTLMRLAMAFMHPTQGNVLVAGQSTAGRGPEDIARSAGYLFQQPELQLFERTVEAEIAFGPTQLGWLPDRTEARVSAVLEQLGLADAKGEHPYDLPLPQRRLVALAAALAADPVLLLLDEPTAGLDRQSRDLVADVVRSHLARGGAAVAVTHDTRFAIEALGRSIVLEGGLIAGEGPTDEVLAGSGGSLPLPPHVALARRLGLAARTLRLEDTAVALAAHCSRDR